MKIAACSSITRAPARLMSMPINPRFDGRRESRSSTARCGSVSFEKLRECPRRLRAWPSLASILMGRAEYKTHRVALAGMASGAPHGFKGLALDGFDAGREPAIGIGCATPMVLVPKIEPTSGRVQASARSPRLAVE